MPSISEGFSPASAMARREAVSIISTAVRSVPLTKSVWPTPVIAALSAKERVDERFMPRPCLARRSEMSSGAGQCSLRTLYKVAHHDCRWADRIDQTNPLACEAGHDVLACGLDARSHDSPRNRSEENPSEPQTLMR